MRRNAAGHRHLETPLEQAATLVLWAETRGVKLAAVGRQIAVDVSDADISPLSEREFEGWVCSLGDALHAILVSRQRPTTVH